jgi:hypothetical protein
MAVLGRAGVDRPHRLSLGQALAVALLAIAFVIGAGVQAWGDSATFDEPVYLSTGVTALLEHDVSTNPEHPPLPKALAALPVLLVHPVHQTSPAASEEHQFATDFMRAQINSGTWHAVVFAGRLVPIAEALVAGLLIFLLGAGLVSVAGGLVGATIWLTAPVVLGFGHLDGVDLPFALATLALAYALLRWWRCRDLRRLVWLGVAAGATAATQITGLILIAFVFLLLVLEGRKFRAGRRKAAAVLALSWATIWASYVILDPTRVLHPRWGLPSPFVDGMEFISKNDMSPTKAYLIGHVWSGGHWWYWPLSLVVKTALPTTLIILFGLAFWPRISRRHRREALVTIVIPICLLMLVLIFDPRDIGVRYLMPQFALLAVLAAPLGFALTGRLGRTGLAAALAGALVTGAISVPHSLAYATPPFTPAYRTVSNSSVDWGQDFHLLQAWAVGKRPYISYFGPRDLSAADVPGARELVGVAPAAIVGWVAVSATKLTSDAAGEFAWLRKYCPLGTLGGSILVYYFTSPPSLVPGPTTPPSPCP